MTLERVKTLLSESYGSESVKTYVFLGGMNGSKKAEEMWNILNEAVV
jgi:hypothetical protein